MNARRTNLASTTRRIATADDGHLDPTTAAVRNVLAVAEQAGAFVGAYRRAAGLARRPGNTETVRAELADLVITAYLAAGTLRIDLDAAIADQLTPPVVHRGWRQPTGGDAA